MTFTTRLKEEISKNDSNNIDDIYTLNSFIKYNAKIDKEISITLENASVTRYIYKLIKEFYNVRPQIVVRNQKRFRVKQIYIIIINDRIDYIKDLININLPDNNEEIIAYLKGAFLASGTISNPSTSGYHLEFITSSLDDSKYIEKLLSNFRITAKHVKRGYKYVTYVKASEQISDIIKMFRAINSLFEFEDVRIYRDHKNMVNRLNNCEIANQEKTLTTGMKQVEEIKFLKEKDLFNLLDEKVQVVAEYRLKYPESSYQELAEIISLESDYKIGKSGVNHNFIKIRELIKKYNKNKESDNSGNF